MNSRWPVCGIRTFLAAVFVLLAPVAPARAAVDEPIAQRVRKAVQLPKVDLSFKFGFVDAEDWLGEARVADAAAEVARLRAGLKGEARDAETLSEIARVTALLEQPDAKSAALKAAVAAWRRWAGSAPDDAAVQVGLARALLRAGEAQEAEQVLRALAGKGAFPVEGQLELAVVLGQVAALPFYSNPAGGPGPLSGGPPLPADVAERCTRQLDEAVALADRVVAADPSNPRAWTTRARLRTNQGMAAFARSAPSAKDRGPAEAMRAFNRAVFPEAAIPDLEAAFRLRPDNPRLVLALAVHHLAPVLGELMEGAMSGRGGEAFDALNSRQRTAADEAMARLGRLAEGSDRLVAAEALEGLALMGLLRGDLVQAGERARRAVRLDPSRTQAFELAMSMIVQARSTKPEWKAAEALLRVRLQSRPEPRSQLMLVKVIDADGRPDDALAEVHRLLKERPDTGPLEVAHLALHVIRGDFPGKDGEAPDLARIGRLLEGMRDGNDKASAFRSFLVTAAALQALAGEVPAALKGLETYVEKVPDDAYGKEMLGLLRQMR